MSAVGATSGHFEATWQGYAYQFEFTASYGGVTKDLAHSGPEDAELTFHWHVTLQVHNESGGREAPPPGRLFKVEGAWPIDSPLCRATGNLDPETSIVRDPVGGGPNDFYDADDSDDANFPYCLVLLGGTSPESFSAPDIGPSGMQVVEATDTYYAQLDEQFVDAALPALQRGPEFWVSSPGGLGTPADQDDSACGFLIWASQSLTACDLQVG